MFVDFWSLGLGVMFCARLMLLGGASLARTIWHSSEGRKQNGFPQSLDRKGRHCVHIGDSDFHGFHVACLDFPFLSSPGPGGCDPNRFRLAILEWRSCSTHVNLKRAGSFESGTHT
jgi:hypothetical protein